MSFNGSGTFNINTSGQPVVAGTTITSAAFNALTADLATGLSTAICKDGQTTVTANIPLNNFKITGLGAGTLTGDAARMSQLQSGASQLLTSLTGTDTLTATLLPTLTAYTTGAVYTFVAANTNTTSVTLNIDALGAKAVTRDGSTALVAGDIVAGTSYNVMYDGTRFQLLSRASYTNLSASGNVTLSGGTANGVAYLNGSKVLTTGSALTFNGTNTQTLQAAAAATATLNLYGNGVIAGLVLQGGSDTNGYISSTNSMYFGTNNVSRASINTTGTFTINPATSGITLDVGAGSGTNASIRTNGSIMLSGAGGIPAATAATLNYETPNTRFYIGDGTGYSFRFSKRIGGVTTDLVQFADTGNVTINAPSSGNTLTVTPFAGGNIGVDVNGNIGAGTAIRLFNTSATDGRSIIEFRSDLTSSKQWAIGLDAAGGTSKSFDFRDLTRSAIPLSIASAGNVTINAPASGDGLTVSGNIALGSGNICGWATSAAYTIGANPNATVTSGGFVQFFGSTNGTPSLVNIGTNNATRMQFNDTGNVTIFAPGGGTALTVTGVAGGNALSVTAGGGGTMTLDSSGNLTVSAMYGTTVTTPRNVFIDSTGKMGGISSTRASKTNIANLDDVSWLYDLNPVTFNYRKRDEDGAYLDECEDETQYGLIAEDTAPVAPDLCIYDAEGKVAGIHYDRMTAPLLKALQQQRDLINDLTQRLAALEGKE